MTKASKELGKTALTGGPDLRPGSCAAAIVNVKATTETENARRMASPRRVFFPPCQEMLATSTTWRRLTRPMLTWHLLTRYDPQISQITQIQKGHRRRFICLASLGS